MTGRGKISKTAKTCLRIDLTCSICTLFVRFVRTPTLHLHNNEPFGKKKNISSIIFSYKVDKSFTQLLQMEIDISASHTAVKKLLFIYYGK